MRVGHNPARFIEKIAQPASITVCVVNFIPFLSGYYEQSLDVLKMVVDSLHATREQEHPYDVMLFDNHSCAEVRAFLQQAYDQGKIQYLVLSDTNIGKIGAWNFMFSAAQGEYVVFSDGDIEFRPGWLTASLEIFAAFPKVGMVTARPLRTPMEFSSATLEWAAKSGVLEKGVFIGFDIDLEHVLSLGLQKDQYRDQYAQGVDYKVTVQGKTALVGAAHFQFMTRRELLGKIIPLPSEQPMRGERRLDIAMNEMGYLRLTTENPYVAHLGNRLSKPHLWQTTAKRKSLAYRLLNLRLIRSILLWLNNQIFRLYFFNVD